MLGSQCPLADRSSGALTGSRVAGAFGLVPVCDAARSHERSWKSHAFKLKHNDAIALFTWVDNLYAVSNKVRGCISILEDVEGHLGRVWDLRYKASSLSVLVCKGSQDRPLN